ncbi:MAG: hypothetical protein JW969_01475 [Spirochaetales bacterium]|nr:hypothetical protein [Spirochaetales bacterium]
MNEKLLKFRFDFSGGLHWKNGLKGAVFICDSSMISTLPAAFKRQGDLCGKTVYLAEDYSPEIYDMIESTCYRGNSTGYGLMGESLFPDLTEFKKTGAPQKPAQDFVTVLGASSYLPDKTAV